MNGLEVVFLLACFGAIVFTITKGAPLQTNIIIESDRPRPCHLHVVSIPLAGEVGLWVDSTLEEPIANLRLTIADAKELCVALARAVSPELDGVLATLSDPIGRGA